MYSFPNLIKKIREASGLTQKEFAKILSVSTVLISMVETGQKEVSRNLITRLANKLKVHPSSITPFLFTDENLNSKNLSTLEKTIIDLGEKLQIFLIEKKSNNLKKYASER